MRNGLFTSLGLEMHSFLLLQNIIPIFRLRDLSQFVFSGLSNDLSSSTNATNTSKETGSSSGTGSKIVIICLVLVAVVLLSFFLFKLWQKKKRQDQYARLLKLFEEDDELELELGLRD
ncbi:uncharacterized protein LOC130755668 isoform X1 [Actinidia eriantha]|uniref:uncharacterized protein LOC130755668 isoform X1 n=1 Tax=Actinidia eriantha TaxID=165200 RepID=UPI00258EC935|nr:uncharacterized protein LOC130755668 isoform X1 [Actinidia eriantha]XP_057466118.1 uncharacterized protein LOC130755668 isoform X1 [Actinidia eriantha]